MISQPPDCADTHSFAKNTKSANEWASPDPRPSDFHLLSRRVAHIWAGSITPFAVSVGRGNAVGAPLLVGFEKWARTPSASDGVGLSAFQVSAKVEQRLGIYGTVKRPHFSQRTREMGHPHYL